MPEFQEYPKTLIHPGFSPAVLGTSPYQGAPIRFAPVTVNSPLQEQEYRAKGYFAAGESSATHNVRTEYPKMMYHPQHVPAVPDTVDAFRDNEGIKTRVTPGSPERFGPVIVKDAEDEAAWIEKGWAVPGHSDKEAFVSAHAALAPDGPKPQDFQEFPKWVNGVVCQDADEETRVRSGQPAKAPPIPSHVPYVPDAPPSVVDKLQSALDLAMAKIAALEAKLEASPPAPQPDERESLRAQCTEHGIEFDARWGVARLKQALIEG